MRLLFTSTKNSTTIHLLLHRRSITKPYSPPFHLPRRSPFQNPNPSLNTRLALQTTTSTSPMEPIPQNSTTQIKLNDKIKLSPTTQEVEIPSSPPDPPPPAPEKPEPGDCCGSGCVPCIWDLYYEELEDYTKKLEAYNMRVSSKHKRDHS